MTSFHIPECSLLAQPFINVDEILACRCSIIYDEILRFISISGMLLTERRASAMLDARRIEQQNILGRPALSHSIVAMAA